MSFEADVFDSNYFDTGAFESGAATPRSLWRVTIGGYEVAINKPWFRKRLNQAGNYKIRIPNDEQYHSILAGTATVYVNLYYEGDLLFEGIRGAVKYGDDVIEISGPEKYCDLDDTIFSKDQGQTDIKRVEYTNASSTTILTDILTGTGYSIGAVTGGTVSMRFELGHRLKCIEALAKRLQSDWWFDGAVCYIGTRGTYRGHLRHTYLTPKTEDYSSIVNKWYGQGYGDGINQPSATVQDTGSQGSYGLRERAFTYRKAVNDEELANVGSYLLTRTASLPETVSALVPWLELYPKNVEPGDTVTITDTRKRLTGGSLQVQTVTLKDETLAELELGPFPTPRSSDLSDKLSDVVEEEGIYAQGATNLYCVSDADACDDSYPMYLRYYIPDDAIAINRVKLNFKREAFRAYSRSASATTPSHTHNVDIGGTTSSSGGDHRHTVFMNVNSGTPSTTTYWTGWDSLGASIAIGLNIDDDDQPLQSYTSSGNHDHSVNFGTKTSASGGTSHTHNLVFGIYEEASPYGSIIVDCNGTAIGTYTSDQNDIALSAYSALGWNYVKMTPDARARIAAGLFVQCFIESK